MPSLSINLSKSPIPKIKRMIEVGNSLGDYTLKDAKVTKAIVPLGSLDAYSCSMVLINNGRNKYLAHIAPELYIPSSLEKSMDKVINNLSKDSDDIQALIIGGWNSQNAQSFELPIFIANTLDKFKIDFSMICGKPKGAKPENLVSLKENVNIWSEKFKDLFEGLDTKKATQDDVQRILENHYEVVELSDNIPIQVIDKFSPKT